MHGDFYFDARHDLFRVAAYVAINSLAANFLPAKELLRGHPRLQWVYCVVINFIAISALNIRRCLPSLDALRAPRERR